MEGQSCPSHAAVNLDWIYPSVTEFGAWLIVVFISTLIVPRLVWYSPLVNFANISQIKKCSDSIFSLVTTNFLDEQFVALNKHPRFFVGFVCLFLVLLWNCLYLNWL